MCAYQTERQKDYVCLSVSEKGGILLSAVYSLSGPVGREGGAEPLVFDAGDLWGVFKVPV